MKKLLILTLALILGLSTVAAANFTNLDVVENPEMTAGEAGEALVEFTYEGNQFDGYRDPFVLNVSFEGESVEGDHFDVEGDLRFDEGGLERTYQLECSSGEEVGSRMGIGEFYDGKVDQINDQSQLCFTEDAITVLPSFRVVDGEVDLDVTPDVRMAPGSYDIQYEFAGWTGLPEFDPVVSTGENGGINESSHKLLEDRGIRLEADPNINFTVVGYSFINAETERPETEEFVLDYYELRPHQDTSGRIELQYDQERVDSREREDPRLYGCKFEDQDCSWDLIAQGEDGLLETDSGFNYTLYGVFTSNVIEEEVVEDEGDSGGSGGSFDVGGDSSDNSDQDTEQNQDEENGSEASEVEEVQLPTSFFEVSYTEPEVSENVRFDATNSYSPNSEIESYEWSFGGRGPQAVHSFEQEEVNVTLTVTDEEGGEDSYSQVINFEQVETAEEDQQNQTEGLTGGFSQSAFNPMNLIEEVTDFFSGLF